MNELSMSADHVFDGEVELFQWPVELALTVKAWNSLGVAKSQGGSHEKSL